MEIAIILMLLASVITLKSCKLKIVRDFTKKRKKVRDCHYFNNTHTSIKANHARL